MTAAFKGLTNKLPKEKGAKKAALFRPDFSKGYTSQLNVWKVQKRTKEQSNRSKKNKGVGLVREIRGLASTLKY
jgi:hypothetical protein